MGFEELIYEVSDRVATITLNRPQRLNALTPTMREEMLAAFTGADADPDVGAIVLTGAGRGFCSGGDVKAMQERYDDKSANPIDERIAPVRDRVVIAMQESSKPVIAAVNGPAAGAGFSMALAADIRVASSSARFGMTFARRGLHPDWGGTYFLPRIVGVARACELIWSGRMMDADEAMRLGIVSELTAPEDLLSTVHDMARTFAAGPPIAIRLAKRSIYNGLNSELRDALSFETFAQNICSATQDAKEGIRAFNEKRDPHFSGR